MDVGPSSNPIDLGVINPDKCRRSSVTHGGMRCSTRFDELGQPHYVGHLDSRQGPVNWFSKCDTCSGSMGDCCGHFGHIELAKPVIRIKFLDWIIRILRCVCFECSRLLVNPTGHNVQKIISTKDIDLNQRLSLISDLCTSNNFDRNNLTEFPGSYRACLWNCCGALQPKFWRSGFELLVGWLRPYSDVTEVKTSLSAEQVYKVLKHVTDEDYVTMGFDIQHAHPLWFILTVLPVPPITGHPAINTSTYSGDLDGLIAKLCTIMKWNDAVSCDERSGVPEHRKTRNAKCLQFHIASLFNDLPRVPSSVDSTSVSVSSIQGSCFPPSSTDTNSLSTLSAVGSLYNSSNEVSYSPSSPIIPRSSDYNPRSPHSIASSISFPGSPGSSSISPRSPMPEFRSPTPPYMYREL